jgi:OFA family oxalate/formate antiporter-like MFS transporter
MNSKSVMHGLVPAMLLSMSVGQIYAFTNFASSISEKISYSQSAVQIAFSLGIFFLGMGAAFFGKFVEKDIKKASFLGMALFIVGLVTTQLSVCFKTLSLLYIGYGLFLGLGTGITYISPVKTMMMWFPDNKALASAIPIVFFGLGSTLSTLLLKPFGFAGIENIFYVYAAFYLILMTAGACLIKKPDGYSKAEATGSVDFSYGKLLKDRFFIHSWLFMFINISAGLSIIPLSRQLMQADIINYSASTIGIFVALAGVFNGGGRLVYAYAADRMKRRLHILTAIIGDSILAIALCIIFPKTFGVMMLFINMCYGAGFSVMPSILSDKFGIADLSKIHGAVLSAWGVAGLIGNNASLLVHSRYGWMGVFVMILLMHIINIANSSSLVSLGSRKEQEPVENEQA